MAFFVLSQTEVYLALSFSFLSFHILFLKLWTQNTSCVGHCHGFLINTPKNGVFTASSHLPTSQFTNQILTRKPGEVNSSLCDMKLKVMLWCSGLIKETSALHWSLPSATGHPQPHSHGWPTMQLRTPRQAASGMSSPMVVRGALHLETLERFIV